ncbi:hypothetical protein KSE_07140 [Kitasatospora setae KM-6054]|uniref:Uncharacterized protein n=2 Tax=Streptomycetaceae TaxID=2062 RepID=E4N5S3_KITSK|nr:hypothetical protein KSE_07140 [Kitasatospora setae KM-6054]
MSNPGSYTYTYEDRETAKLRRSADAFRYSAAMEHLAEMKRDRPEQYDQMNPLSRISLGHYEIAKAAAVQLGRSVSAPTDREA